MKTKRIITATILSTGLILGTTNAALAVDPAPSANLTAASYSSQLATFNLAAAAFGDATVAFRSQVTANAAAIAAYKVSYTALQATYQAAVAANAPVSTAQRYANLMVAYSTASTSYHTSARLFASQSNTYEAAVQRYEMAYRAAIDSYKVAIASYGQLNLAIYANYQASVTRANSAFAKALKSAKTKSQIEGAKVARAKSLVAAIAVRNAAWISLGSAPVKPIKQIEIGQNVDLFQVVRLAHPVLVTK